MAGEHFGRAKKSHHDTHLHLPTNFPYQESTFYTLWKLRNNPDKIFKTHGHYKKVKG